MSHTFGHRILDGKVAYIAGGTRGMNLKIAERYAEHGAKVAVMSRNPERCETAADKLRQHGGEAIGLSADARDYDAVEATLKETHAQFGPIDIVVAGQAGNFFAPVLGMSSNGFKTIIDIDLIGTFNVFRASFPFLNKPGASLLAITAPEAVKPLHFQSHVCAAKAAVNMFLRCLALEWGPAGIRVNGLSPGPIDDSWGMKNVIATSPEIYEQIRGAVPLARWGKEAEIADGALFLASEASGYITGNILDIDGGVSFTSPEQGHVDAINFEDNPRIRANRPPSKD
jgi:NAD(P)-dependent dehydrogenase (short-subunit alcohol dehydrogenase family)